MPQPYLSLQDYARQVDATDKLRKDELRPVLLGLFGEVGSVMATTKKRERDKVPQPEGQQAVQEELGDVLWYFSSLCARLGFSIEGVFSSADERLGGEDALIDLGKAAANLLTISEPGPEAQRLLRTFAGHYVREIEAEDLRMNQVVCTNVEKILSRFTRPDMPILPTFDADFPEEERLPSRFEIKILQRNSGRSQLQWNGVFIGDPLTDSSRDKDDYRFHDVFHLANAAILHWSPTFRSLIQQKRKSCPEYDEAEDGGRAIVIEEGLAAWIFSRAKNCEYFRDQDQLSFGLLKTVQQFVSGYEVQECPLSLWEKAILEGYKVFRQVREANGGVVVGDRDCRTISYRPLESD